MSGPRLNAAFYAAPVSEFLAASNAEAYAPLAAPKGYTLAPEQLSAWHLQLPVLRAALAGLEKGTQLFSSDGSLPPTESLEKSCVPFSPSHRMAPISSVEQIQAMSR